MKRFLVLVAVAYGFILATEFLGGSELVAFLCGVAAVQGALASGWRGRPSDVAFSHVALGLAYAFIHSAIRCGRPMVYPPLVVLSGLWIAALMVIAAAAATAIVARLRRP